MFLKFTYNKKDSTYSTHELINVDSAEKYALITEK